MIIIQKEVKTFDYRVPLQWVTYVSIDGDATIDHVQWGGKYYVSFHLSNQNYELKSVFF